MEQILFLRLRKRLVIRQKDVILLGDICQLYLDGEREEKLRRIPLYQVKKEDGNLIIIDIMQVIRKLRQMYPEIHLKVQGSTQIIVEVENPAKRANFFLVSFVWLLLFIGSGLALMNFHADVSMLEVQRRLYQLITGQYEKRPLLLQIPYSLGIGLGMVLFFNHIFRKRFNEEPSPLDVELFLYQQNLDQYYLENENEENQRDKT
ncbi:stage V sporulation protein AA [Brevibacillus sp. 7WMA2]|uniref:Stage V sporulation protein AA n=1 Tax=Brevibacillus laterosporus LMG 15441 TaxID=1042163 RepID=A0A075R3M1_BRELA|nr:MULTISPECIES: stage V sporulation protein AA [Brevibacillus]AIG26081.1 stage V sporulation protein AA [Brevibacillus laterosporus LMG 15441]AUM64706.1 stage V sporulation protein AA [Brevibacillus laterosporus]AYK07626.1 stage V sporulation protein AA [Brevibacillus laterosporus]ERM20273.1 stage V sporulation protein AA [Brevibacillus laterosporus PE36]MBA4535102.1 stage V sporulation protein AA [Brevibacillus halotolerans]